MKIFLKINAILLIAAFLISCSNDDDVVIEAELTTSTVTDITQTEATSGGDISSDGGSEITESGVVWSTSENPTINDNLTEDGASNGSFISNLSNLSTGTTYFVRSYATNSAGTAYGNEVSFTTLGIQQATITTTNITEVTETTAISGGDISDDGGDNITARGVVWSTSQEPTVNDSLTVDGTGAGSFISNLSNLNPETTYFVRAYATNSEGTAYGEQLEFTTDESDNTVTNPETGRVWMDRNLGASQVATSFTDEDAYGDLYQWGRGTDGHEKRTSASIAELTDSETPEHGDFIRSRFEPRDWLSTQNDNLWQGVDGINNPCPSGYRLPTEAEWREERQSWRVTSAYGAFESQLKLTMAGLRSNQDGSFYYEGGSGHYQSSTIDGISIRTVFFNRSQGRMFNNHRAEGLSVRCIKD